MFLRRTSRASLAQDCGIKPAVSASVRVMFAMVRLPQSVWLFGQDGVVSQSRLPDDAAFAHGLLDGRVVGGPEVHVFQLRPGEDLLPVIVAAARGISRRAVDVGRVREVRLVLLQLTEKGLRVLGASGTVRGQLFLDQHGCDVWAKNAQFPGGVL